ncbi:peptidoglycan D,D-transpeptidase FtsI family protein [Aureibacter tunicatorum]|uniref:Penicillin-binding protein 2 n=1 Tax=Aureibacter tunicatorum TaxID=866807 RepID=A0AAE3XKQ4_9BACT|nr:penicillin-binding transpeptidase domain-containing protein [Aureibacter tunicatorum]MDR6238398.1 penicillin-binding protein 2 [Aureibacter tunicatorum]BDD03430.1 penicillin-binding protein 2 [Aureibacter tunicatorum]
MNSEQKKYIVQGAVLFIVVIFLVRLAKLQVFDSTYKSAAENNIMRKYTEYPYRGLITDREGDFLVINEPVYDLVVVPNEVRGLDTLSFCELFGIEKVDFEEKLSSAKKYSWVKSSAFLKQFSNQEVAAFQDFLVNYPGFYLEARTIRSYPQHILAGALGYTGEVSAEKLERDTTGYYRRGDFIGINGLERYYEGELRGKRGVRYKMVDVRGIVKGKFKEGEYDTLSQPGMILKSTIDPELQKYGELLMDGKMGSIVAIEPRTGEVLSIISAPSYDPNLLSGRNFGSNYGVLVKDSLRPLFNRPIMATYPPGSIFKMVNSLIFLQEGVIGPHEKIYCDNSLIKDHAPPGSYDVKKSIQYSSNNFYVIMFKRLLEQGRDPNRFKDAAIGLEKWKSYVNKFGLGSRLGVDLPNEKSGSIPGRSLYDKFYGRNRWKASTIASLSIGQGEMLVTPIQMANVAAIIANKGYYYPPHIIKEIGESGAPLDKYQEKYYTGINREYFDPIYEGMSLAADKAARSLVPGINICGKTGTAQNPHGADHSVFVAFAPKENPKIALAVYVENAGWGARAAASIASLMMEKYLKGEVSQEDLEAYVLKGDFLDGEMN